MNFKNVAICDLRGYNSLEAASTVESVQNAALVILPKEADEKTRAALAKIEMHNVAMMIYADMDVPTYTYNGSITLSDANLPDGESICLINGSARVLPISPEKQVSLVVNGKIVYDKNSKNIKLLNVNGKVIPWSSTTRRCCRTPLCYTRKNLPRMGRTLITYRIWQSCRPCRRPRTARLFPI